MDDVDPLSVEWSEPEVAVMHALADWAVAFAELNRHLSTWMRLPGSDANALGHVVWAEQAGAPLSPAELSRRIGMTTGAASVLIDRLETAGHVERHREGADRRRVTLRPTDSARSASAGFLRFAGQEIASTVRGVDDADLSAARVVLERMTAAATAANRRLVGR